MTDARVVEVAAVAVFPHDPQPCRHCGHVYENNEGSCGACDGAPRGCPQCGCPREEPINAGNKTET